MQILDESHKAIDDIDVSYFHQWGSLTTLQTAKKSLKDNDNKYIFIKGNKYNVAECVGTNFLAFSEQNEYIEISMYQYLDIFC